MDRYRNYRPDYRSNCGQTRSVPPAMPGNCPYNKDTIYRHVDEMPLTMGYVPMQQFKTTFELCKALHVGTIFPELCKPFVGKRGRVC